MNSRKIQLVALIFAAFSVTVLMMSLQGQGQNKTRSPSQHQEQDVPIVDYGSPKTESAKLQSEADRTRRARSARYDTRRIVRDVDTGGTPVLGFSHWDAALPALPVVKSALVVIGQVVDAKAYLSNDKTGVYSEFGIRVERIFKNDNSSPISPGQLVSAERWGGRVRFPSGRVLIFGNRGQGTPRIGEQYIFFLERNPEQYAVLTAYELLSGEVHPLDGKAALGGENSEWPGNAYEGMNAANFFSEVESAVAKSLIEPGT
jgi:hypothetical protein